MPSILLPVPHHPQRGDSDCLAACSAMVLGHLGVSIAYDRLLRLLNVTPWGTPGSHLRNLTGLGVEVHYALGSVQQMLQHLVDGHPCIALVRTEHFQHWTYGTDHAVVVVGYDDLGIAINDPAFEQAPHHVSRPEFELAWMDFDYRYATVWR